MRKNVITTPQKKKFPFCVATSNILQCLTCMTSITFNPGFSIAGRSSFLKTDPQHFIRVSRPQKRVKEVKFQQIEGNLTKARSSF